MSAVEFQIGADVIVREYQRADVIAREYQQRREDDRRIANQYGAKPSEPLAFEDRRKFARRTADVQLKLREVEA